MRESISIIKEKTASDISTAFHQSVGSVLDYNTGRYSRLKGQPDLCHQLMIPLNGTSHYCVSPTFTVQCTVREAYRSMDLVEGVELIFSKFTALIESLIYLHRESRMDVLMTVEKQLKKRFGTKAQQNSITICMQVCNVTYRCNGYKSKPAICIFLIFILFCQIAKLETVYAYRFL